jgi:hypothetical protein
LLYLALFGISAALAQADDGSVLTIFRSQSAREALQPIGDKGKITTVQIVLRDATRDDIEALQTLPGLRKVFMCGQKVTDASAAKLEKLKNLRELSFYHNRLTDAGVEHFRSLTTLENFALPSSLITDKGLESVGAMANLRELRLTDAGQAAPVTDDGLIYLANLTKLRKLTIGYERITDSGLAGLQAIQSLEELNLYRRTTSAEGLKFLTKMPRLKKLGLAYNQEDGEVLVKLHRMLPNCAIDYGSYPPSGLWGQPAWFPLGGEVYHSQDRFEAEKGPLAFKPQPRWFVGLVRKPGSLEEKIVSKTTGQAEHASPGQLSDRNQPAGGGPPLAPPKQLDDLPILDQGAWLSFSVAPAETADRLRFSLTLKSSARTVWREVEHRWTNTLPLLFAFYADGQAVIKHPTSVGKFGGTTQSEELVKRDGQKNWSLMVDAKSIGAILENTDASELSIVAVFAERQHEGYTGNGPNPIADSLIEAQVPRAAIVVRSNVVRLKRSAGKWEIAKPTDEKR